LHYLCNIDRPGIEKWALDEVDPLSWTA
jgi:hypothetical protein